LNYLEKSAKNILFILNLFQFLLKSRGFVGRVFFEIALFFLFLLFRLLWIKKQHELERIKKQILRGRKNSKLLLFGLRNKLEL